MRVPLRTTHLLTTLAFLVASALAPARAQDDTEPEEPPEAALSTDPARNAEILRVASVLRRSRLDASAGRAALEQSLAVGSEQVVDALLDVLIAGRVPRTAPEQGRQVLSEPQTDLVLGALARIDSGRVRFAAEKRLKDVETKPACRAAVLALAATGDATVFERFLRDWRMPDGRVYPELAHAEWRRAFVLLLRKNPSAIDAAVRGWRDAGPERQRGLVEAVGELRLAPALALIAPILEEDGSDLGVLAMSQVARIGRGYDPSLDARLCESLRRRVDPSARTLCQSALQALGELRDRPTVATCLDLLESDDLALRQAALWSLRRSTGMDLDGKRASWTRWLATQEKKLADAPRKIVPKLGSSNLATVIDGLRSLADLRVDRVEVARWIEPLLERREPGLRVLACETLAEIDERSSTVAVAELLHDADARVRAAARAALQKLTGRELPEDDDALAALLAGLGLRS